MALLFSNSEARIAVTLLDCRRWIVSRVRNWCIVWAIVAAWAWSGGAGLSGAEVKNVIVMIGDGAGFNCWLATSMYEGRWDAAAQKCNQVYNGAEWINLANSTYPLTILTKPSKKNVQDPELVYDPQKAWDKSLDKDGVPAAYKALKSECTDSAAAATAMSTGKKTYNVAINWSDLDASQGPTLSELAKSRGKSVGIVTSVQWSHATPAGFSNAHVADRNSYEEIAKQMLSGDALDVVMGCGNPDFDDNGEPQRNKSYKYVGGEEAWKAIEMARSTAEGTYHGFRPVSTKSEFESLLTGATPSRVLGTAQVAQTLQQARSRVAPGAAENEKEQRAAAEAAAKLEPPYTRPVIATVPSLSTMAKGALHVLENNPKGLFLMVEGGAVDWANHNNQPGRMIEELSEFNRTVEAVVAWVDSHSNWQETLLIVTADHETGLLWGPDSKMKAFDPVVDKGQGQMPGLGYNHTSHTNSLVPLFARGAGADEFSKRVVGTDPVRGPYVTNTAIFDVAAIGMSGDD